MTQRFFLILAALLALAMPVAVIAGSGFAQDEPGRDLNDDERFYAGKAVALIAVLDGAADQLRSNTDNGLTDDATLTAVIEAAGGITFTAEAVEALDFGLRGSSDEVHESLTGVAGDLVSAAEGCIDAAEASDQSALEACNADLREADRALTDLYESVVDWMDSGDFTYTRD